MIYFFLFVHLLLMKLKLSQLKEICFIITNHIILIPTRAYTPAHSMNIKWHLLKYLLFDNRFRILSHNSKFVDTKESFDDVITGCYCYTWMDLRRVAFCYSFFMLSHTTVESTNVSPAIQKRINLLDLQGGSQNWRKKSSQGR